MRRAILVTALVVGLCPLSERLATAAAPVLAQVQVFTDPASYLAALEAQGLIPIHEGFEGAPWTRVRTTIASGARTALRVASLGITWSAGGALTTGDAAARSGWAAFDLGGAPGKLHGTSPRLLRALGGFLTTNTPGAEVAILLDGRSADGASLVPDSSYRFIGLISSLGFHSFEIADTEAMPGSPRNFFADDFTLATAAMQRGETTGVVPAVANTPGRFGSVWHSDLVLHNATAEPADLELHFVPQGATLDPSTGPTVTLVAGQTLVVTDVVATLFGATGSGALLWTVRSGDPGRVLVSGVTYSLAGAARRFGQDLPGIRWDELAGEGTPLTAPAFSGPSRTNLGVFAGPTCTGALVRVLDAAGSLVIERSLAVQPLSWLLLDNLLGGLPAAGGAYRVEVTGVGGSLLALSSVVDNVSNDPATFLAVASGASDLWLPGAAHTSGHNGSEWRSDLILANRDPGQIAARLAFYARGAVTAAPPRGIDVSAGAGATQTFADVTLGLLSRQPPALGCLRLRAAAPGAPFAWLRTSTSEGAGASRATYGQAIPALTEWDAVVPAFEGRLAGWSHNRAHRANLILQNTHSTAEGMLLASEPRIEVLDAAGSRLAAATVALGPGEYLQLNSFTGLLGGGDVTGGTVRITVPDNLDSAERGGVLALLMEVDGNLDPGSNDSRVVKAQLIPVAAQQ